MTIVRVKDGLGIVNVRDELISRAIESGKVYADQSSIREIAGMYMIDIYYHRNYAHTYYAQNELEIEFMIDQLEKKGGYKDYETFAKENDYDLDARMMEVHDSIIL